MSSVRMCDDCGAIFSENEEDWATAPVSINRRDERGNLKPVNLQEDYCPECVHRKAGNNSRQPRVPAVKGRYDPRYTAQLEREVGITDGSTTPLRP